MLPLNRRDFLRAATAGACLPALRAASPEARIDVLLEETVGVIAPEIYSHFVENLGGVVYDGIWVGEGSSIPNVNGIRKELVDALRRVKPGVIRWPGGCFADQYDWRDGTGARDKRPRRTNFWNDSAEPSQPTGAGILALGGILQLARRNHYARGPARVRRRTRTAERALLGRGQRIVGLRRQFRAGRLCRRIRTLYRLGAFLWCAPRVRGLRTQR